MSGRRKNKRGSEVPPKVFRHTMNTMYHDKALVSPTATPAYFRRLIWCHEGPTEFDGGKLARIIEHPSRGDVQWFCDSNFFIGPTDQAIWDALLAKQGRLVLASPVYEEIRDWLAEPRCNRAMSERISQEVNDPAKPTVRICDFPDVPSNRPALYEYYVNLLGLRKKAFGAVTWTFSKVHGRPPTNQELSNHCKDKLGPRAQRLARSGVKGKVPAHKYNDEALVMLAVVDAIYSGRETVILTKDEDVYEQFFKALWLIDTHYRSMLLAERYAADPEAFQIVRRIVDAEHPAFDGEVLLLRKPSNNLMELVPKGICTCPRALFIRRQENRPFGVHSRARNGTRARNQGKHGWLEH